MEETERERKREREAKVHEAKRGNNEKAGAQFATAISFLYPLPSLSLRVNPTSISHPFFQLPPLSLILIPN